jgi:hypothetical protein
MRKSTRFALAAGVVAASFAATGSALAAYTPKIYVKSLSTGSVNLRVAGSATDDPTARVQFYVPTGYTTNFTAGTGTVLGPASAQAQVADLANAIVPLQGTLVVADPLDPATASASARCDPVPHAAVWLLSLTAAGNTLPIPIFVDQTSGALAAIASYTLTVCLPPPDLPPGTPGRGPLGAKLINADITVSAITAPTAAGTFPWRAIWTPYNPGVGTVNAGGTVQTQSLWFQPTTLTVASKITTKRTTVRVKKKRVARVSNTATIFGTLSAAGQGAPGQPVDIYGGASASSLKKLKTVTTNAAGAYIYNVKLTKTTYFQARATSADRELGTTLCAPGIPTPCISATVSGGSLTSGTVKTVPRKR